MLFCSCVFFWIAIVLGGNSIRSCVFLLESRIFGWKQIGDFLHSWILIMHCFFSWIFLYYVTFLVDCDGFGRKTSIKLGYVFSFDGIEMGDLLYFSIEPNDSCLLICFFVIWIVMVLGGNSIRLCNFLKHYIWME